MPKLVYSYGSIRLQLPGQYSIEHVHFQNHEDLLNGDPDSIIIHSEHIPFSIMKELCNRSKVVMFCPNDSDQLKITAAQWGVADWATTEESAWARALSIIKPPKHKDILLVSKDKNRACWHSKRWKELGASVQIESDPESVISLAKISRPTVLVTDYIIPPLNGVVLAKAVRMTKLMEGVPVVILGDNLPWDDQLSVMTMKNAVVIPKYSPQLVIDQSILHVSSNAFESPDVEIVWNWPRLGKVMTLIMNAASRVNSSTTLMLYSFSSAFSAEEASRIIAPHIRGHDIVGRISSTSVGVFMMGCETSSASLVAERLLFLLNVPAKCVVLEQDTPVDVTTLVNEAMKETLDAKVGQIKIVVKKLNNSLLGNTHEDQ